MKQSPTEELNQKNLPIDKLTINDSFKFMIEDQLNAIKAVDKQIKKINQIIKVLVNHFQKNNSGRLVYCGAGTSGRVGVQDAVELYPTFGWPRRNINFMPTYEYICKTCTTRIRTGKPISEYICQDVYDWAAWLMFEQQ